ncbi:condensation domain-containing protein, partial [Curtanaerobium respiraculi]
ACERDHSVTLHAYVVPRNHEEAGNQAYFDELEQRLPSYFIPATIDVLQQVPTTANGKVDRASLIRRAASMEIADSPSCALEGTVEHDVAAVWRDVLRVDGIDAGSDFFALGGDSLRGSRAIAALRRRGYHEASLQGLFRCRVLRDFARQVGVKATREVKPAISHDEQAHFEDFPLTEIQHAYAMSKLGETRSRDAATTYTLFLRAPYLAADAFEMAWKRVWMRHPMLRAEVGQSAQRFIPDAAFPGVERQSFTQERQAQAFMEEWQRAAYPLSRYPSYGVCIIACDEWADQSVIGYSFDFMLLDATSVMHVIADTLRYMANPSLALPAISLDFRDCVVGLGENEHAREEAKRYWHSLLADFPKAPLASLRGLSTESHRIVRLQKTLTTDEWNALSHRAHAVGATPTTLLLTCYAKVLSRWSGGEDIALNVTAFNRPDGHPEIDLVAGDFTTLVPVRYRQIAGESFGQALDGMKTELAAALDHRAVSSVWMQKQIAEAGEEGTVTLPVVFTSALGMATEDEIWKAVRYQGGLSATPQVILDNQILEFSDEVVLCWDFDQGDLPRECI